LDFAIQLSHRARFQLSLDLQGLGRIHGGLHFTFEAPSDRRFDGDRERSTQGGRDFVMHVVQFGYGRVIDRQTLTQFLVDLHQVVALVLDHLLKEFLVEREETDGLTLESGAEVGFWFVVVFVAVIAGSDFQVFREDVFQFLLVLVLVVGAARLSAQKLIQGASATAQKFSGVLVEILSDHGLQTFVVQIQSG